LPCGCADRFYHRRTEEVTLDEVERILVMSASSSLAVRGPPPSLHARMETAEIVHDAGPFQALGASDVEAPVRGGRRMLEDVGIHPLDAVVHMQSGAGPNASLSISIS
jgi:hypothetical protein